MWHPDVRFFAVRENGETLAHFYMDPFVRNGLKRGGAWAVSFTSRCDRRGEKQVSLVVLNLKEADADSLVGAICGLCYLRGGFFTNYTIDLSGNAYVASAGHTSGGVIAEYQFYYLPPDVVYTEYFFENTQGYGDYVTEILDFGASSVTLEQLKAMEIYYE